MIENTLVHFKTKAAFNTELEAGNIKNDSITFVQDSKEIITHGESYKGVGWSNIEKAKLPNGVYAVSTTGKLIDVATADTSCVAVALITNDQMIMITKNNVTDSANDSWCWESESSDLSLTNYSTVDGTNVSGYLPNPDGTYQDAPNLSGDPATWITGALSDFDGKNNTAVITANAPALGDIGYAVKTFNAATNGSNAGKNDWYIPSIGQLAFIRLFQSDIDNALISIGGRSLDQTYWSSSEYSSTYAWCFTFDRSGYIRNFKKSSKGYVRFIRDISESISISDTANIVNTTFIHCPEKSQFTEQLESGNVSDDSIAFIKDTEEIYTHGTYYGGKSINTNGTITAVVAMTQSEYDALTTKDSTTLYIITE